MSDYDAWEKNLGAFLPERWRVMRRDDIKRLSLFLSLAAAVFGLRGREGERGRSVLRVFYVCCCEPGYALVLCV